ncbi:MAG: GTP-binding DUF697 domain-containing protein [Gemmataceae bacterium]|nr:GTP-binding DUF697 domain-containing protein [Gemmataceae bacterium]
MLQKLRKLFSSSERDARLHAQLDHLRQKTPVPNFWLFGRTQSGKTSIIKYLTGAEEGEIGHGFRPCTRFSRLYEFPTNEAPLLTFLDTRGLDEPGYDPAEDMERFGNQAHVVIVTAKVMDHALENVLKHLQTIRQSQPGRPVILALTCLHEAYPQQQHPEPYPFGNAERSGSVPEALARSLAEQTRRFDGLVDRIVPIDLTKPEEGFQEPNYGGDALKQTLIDVLPAAYRQTLVTLDEASRALQDVYMRNVLPHIVGYSTLAGTAGAIPIPWLDLLILPGIQTRMIYHLARLYGQPLSGTRFLELASTLGIGLVARQAMREVMKFIPYVGSVAGAALAGASTFALGKAFCYYYSAVHKGHVPQAEDLRRYYQEQLSLAEKVWGRHKQAEPTDAHPPNTPAPH